MENNGNENPESYKKQSGFPPGQNELGCDSPKDKLQRSQVEKASDHSPGCDVLTYFHKEKDFEEKHSLIEMRQKKVSIVLAPISDDAKKCIYSTIDTVIQHKHNKHCLGVLLLIHNDTAPPAMTNFKILDGMGKGVEKLKIEFEKLGFAVVWLKNPTSAEVKASMDYLSSEEVITTIPESFKFFGVYVTCHGNNRTFFTKDGSMSYDSIASVAKRDNLQKKLQLFLFIFDCCRSSPATDVAAYPDGKISEGEPSLPESNMGPNTMILYAQSGGGTTWGPGDGITYMAHDLLDLIDTDIHLVSLPTKLRERNNKRPLPSTMISPSHDTLCKEFILVKERDDKMAPRLKELVVISADGAVAELHVNPRPSVNSAHFEHEEFDVQMRPGSTENWLSLKIYGETSRKYMSSSSSAASIGSSPSSSTDGKVILTAVLPVDHRTRISNAKFRVISKMSGGLCLPSNVAEVVALPEISQPKITKTIVCLKDCHPLELQTAWRLENKLSLQLSKFLVHVFKNGTKVHTTEIPAERNKAEYSATFFVPEVIKSETGDTYEVCVEAEREHDKKRIPSIRMKAPRPEKHFPSLKEVQISEDGATATATVSFESVLDDETLNEQQYKLEMKVENEQEWKTLTKFQNFPLSEPVPINIGCQSPIALQESASFAPRQPATPDLCPPVARSTSIDSTDAHRMTLTALLPLDRKKCRVKFRVISERHNSLSIPSSSSPIKDLEEIAQPKITETTVCLKDCHPLELETVWCLENKLSLQLSKFLVHVFKNGTKVHTTEIPAERNKAEYSATFFVPEVIKSETGDTYEVCVEAEREHDKRRIPSIRMKAPRPEKHFPSLKEVQISEDGATVTATVSFESVLDDETLNEQQYKLEMKVENEQEWKMLTNFQNSILSEPVPINIGRQSSIALQESASVAPRQPAIPDLCPPMARSTSIDSTDAHRMTLTALLPLDRKKCRVKFRVISERHNSLSIPSSSSPIIDLEEIAKPQVQEDGLVRFYNCRSPMATGKWKIQTPLSVQLSKFTVCIYRGDEEVALCFEDVPYKRDEVDYCFEIPIAELIQKVDRVNQYTVCIEATRTDDSVIRSDRVDLTTKPELCYNIWTHKCVCYVLMIVAAIFALIIGVTLATILIIDINPHYLKSDIPWAPANLVSEIPKPLRDSLSSPFRATDFTQESVERRKNDELTIYCAEIEIERLNNHQKVKYKLSFNEFNQNLTETTALLPLSLANPTAYYVLSQSKLSVILCLSDREVHPLSVKLLLYKRVDQNSWEPENNVVVASQNVTFNSSSCTNTTVVALESAVVYLALSSPDSVSFKSITGNVKQFYYDETALDIVNVSNIVSEEHPKIISGSSSKKLVCYVWREFDDDLIVYEIIFLRVPIVWRKWTLPVFIPVLCISLLFSLCVCIVCCSFAACRKHGTHDYSIL